MKKNFSLMIKIMSTVNITTIVMIILFSMFLSKVTENQLELAAKTQTITLINSIKLTTAEYIWNLNNSALKTISDKLTEDKMIVEVSFLDVKDTVLANAKTSKENLEDSYKVNAVKSEVVYGDKNEKIGFVEIKYNLNNVREFKSKLLKYTAIAVIFVQFIICIAVYFVLKITNNKLKAEFDKLKEISDITYNSSQDSSEFAKAVSASTTEQASAIQETVATLTQITEMVNTSVASATNSSDKASVSFDQAKLGQEVVKEMINSMKEIDDSNSSVMSEVNKSNERIKDIVSVISEISTKTNVINDIVFQTKLLSFNASVEAARAGEHGKGFAVVAEEVGNLAQMSGNAAKEISVLLDQSISRVNQIISETNTGVERVIKNSSQKIETGVKTAEKCDAVLSEIVEIAVVVKNMMNEVAHASKEQATGVQNISQAMNQVDQMVHSNETSASKSNETAQKLLDQSNELKKVVENIESVIFGGKILKIASKEKTSAPPPPAIAKKIAKKEVKEPVKKIVTQEKKVEPVKVTKAQEVKEEVKELKVAVDKKSNKKEVKVNLDTVKEANNVIPSADDKRFEDV